MGLAPMPDLPEKGWDQASRKRTRGSDAASAASAAAPTEDQLDLLADWLSIMPVAIDAAQVKKLRHKRGKPPTESKIEPTTAKGASRAEPPGQTTVNHTQRAIPADPRLYLSVQRVARRYDVSVATIWRWVKAGEFPKPRKIAGRITRWAVADLEAYDRAMR